MVPSKFGQSINVSFIVLAVAGIYDGAFLMLDYEQKLHLMIQH